MTHVLAVRLDNDGDVLLAGPAIRALAAGADRVTLLGGGQVTLEPPQGGSGEEATNNGLFRTSLPQSSDCTVQVFCGPGEICFGC